MVTFPLGNVDLESKYIHANKAHDTNYDDDRNNNNNKIITTIIIVIIIVMQKLNIIKYASFL